jgi:hypothetical protein
MISVRVFVTGGAARAQFLSAVSPEFATSSLTVRTGIAAWVCLTTQVAGQTLNVHLLDGGLLPNGLAPSDLLFEGLLGFVVIDDGSPDADRRGARAYAPTPYVVLVKPSMTIQSREEHRCLLEQVPKIWTTKEFDNPISRP